MKQEQLQETLKSLHAELNDAKSVDDETRALLVELADDVQRLSEQDAANTADEVEPLSERLADFVLKIEADHPQLTRALNQVSAALANLGI